ncbi:MAG: hypothetical protein ACYTGX_03955 [Planctomycetota bacterium]
MQPTPTSYTLLDLIMAGGCLGLCTWLLLPLGVVASLVALKRARRRRTAILIPAIFSGLALLTSTSGVALGYITVNQKIAVVEQGGGWVSDAERADAAFLLWSAGIQGAIVCAILLGLLMLAVLTKRDRDADAD